MSDSQLYMQDPDKALFNGKTEADSICELEIEQIAFAITRGDGPASVGKSEKIALRHAVDYVEAVINADVSRVDCIEKSPFVFAHYCGLW